MSGSAVKLSMRLRTLIGQRVIYRDRDCEILEVLDDGPAIVLRCAGSARIIQPNQYGDASRRVPQTHTIPVFEADSNDPHPEFLALGLTEILDD